MSRRMNEQRRNAAYSDDCFPFSRFPFSHNSKGPNSRSRYSTERFSDVRKQTFETITYKQQSRKSGFGSYATAQSSKPHLRKKLGWTNRNPVTDHKPSIASHRLHSRVERLQSVQKTPHTGLGLSLPTRRRISGEDASPLRNRKRYSYNEQKVSDTPNSFVTIDIEGSTESTLATLADDELIVDGEHNVHTSTPACLDIINDFEALMPNLNESRVVFDLFPQQLQIAIAFLQQAQFTYVSPFDAPVLPCMNKMLPRKQTLVLDLDETLMHCARVKLDTEPHFLVKFDGLPNPGCIYVRPYAREFLKAVSKMFEVVIFTASTSPYANQVLDQLDPCGDYIHHRLYRQHCTYQCGGYVKDLRILGRDLKDTLIVDNSPISAAFQLDNFVPISSWHGDENDRELFDLLHQLTGVVDDPNTAKWLSRRYGFRDWINAGREDPNYNDHCDLL